MALNEGQLVAYAVDEVIETLANVLPMAERVEYYNPPAAEMQRSGNTIWMPVEQEAPTQRGWDLTGKQTDILELSVAVNMSDPDNDFFRLRADDVRDETSYRRRIRASAKKLANNLEKQIADQAMQMGSLVVTSPTDIGTDGTAWDFMAEAETRIFERELNRDEGLAYFFNPEDYRRAGHDLTGKDFYGRIPEDAYRNGEIGKQLAGFDDVLRSPKLSPLAASEATGVTVSGSQSFKPQAWEVNAAGEKQNVDNRFATVTVSDGSGFKRGDKISFAGVKFLSQMAKDVLTTDATFSVAAVNGNNITITPKPVALTDPSLSAAERAYANVNIPLADGMAINVLNVNTVTPNVFWANDSIRLVSQPIPLDHDLFAGMRSQSFSIDGIGINGVIAFQGDIETFSGQCRIALWYQASVVRPEAVGVGLSRQTAA